MPRKTPTSVEYVKELFWRKALLRQVESGLTQTAFCKQEGLNANIFSWWKREISRRDRLVSEIETNQAIFVPVTQQRDTTEIASMKPIAEIDLAAGLVRIFAGIDRHALHEIMTVLKETRL